MQARSGPGAGRADEAQDDSAGRRRRSARMWPLWDSGCARRRSTGPRTAAAGSAPTRGRSCRVRSVAAAPAIAKESVRSGNTGRSAGGPSPRGTAARRATGKATWSSGRSTAAPRPPWWSASAATRSSWRYAAPDVAGAVTAALARQPAQIVRSLTWDQGREMARRADIETALGIEVFFCEPHHKINRVV